MEPYILAVISSVLFARLTHAIKGRGRFLQYVVPCLPFCVLAALRDPSIGTDTQVYVVPIFNFSRTASLAQLMSSYYVSHFEPLFLIVVWFISSLTCRLGAVCFVLQLFVVLPIMRLGYKLNQPLWIVSVTYGLCFFPFTLNIIRQSISIAIMLYSVMLVVEKEQRKALALLVVAYLFHRTALLWIISLPICMAFNKDYENNVSYRRSIEFLIFYGSLFLIMLIIIISFGRDILDDMPFYTETIAAQLAYRSSGLTISAFFILISTTLSFIMTTKRNKYTYIFYIILILGTSLQQMSLLGSQMARIGMTFLFSYVPVCGNIYSHATNKNKQLISIIIITTSIIYFIYVYAVGNSGNVIPFRFIH